MAQPCFTLVGVESAAKPEYTAKTYSNMCKNNNNATYVDLWRILYDKPLTYTAVTTRK